jgi:hypothetical protein
MKNPFKPDRSSQDRDNPVVPDAVERPVDSAADRAAIRDNPLVPNAIERPVERAMGSDSGTIADRRHMDHSGFTDASDRRRFVDDPGDEARARATAASIVERPLVDDRRDRPEAAVRHEPERGMSGLSGSTNSTRQMDLFPEEELVGYRTRWEAIQTGFVDQPRTAVEQADALVSQVVTRLTDVFSREHSSLEGQWTRGDDVSTEDLRIALTRYRSFFNRLLSL